MTARSRVAVGLMVTIVLAMAVMLLTYELPINTLLWIEIQNAGHTPIFGIIALLLLGISFIVFRDQFRQRWLHYLLALVGASALGLITEFAQLNGPRDADVGDLIRDVAGAVAFLGIFMFFDRGRETQGTTASKLNRTAVFILALAVLAASLVPLALWVGAYLHRNSTFPVICDFDSYWGNKFLSTEDARLSTVPVPAEWSHGKGDVARLILKADDFPGMAVMEPCPDWRAYRTLSFDLFLPEDTAVNIKVRIEDSHHNDIYADRFNRTFSIVPGENQISISLSDVETAPRERRMDMAAIGPVHIFAVDLNYELTLFVDNIRLE